MEEMKSDTHINCFFYYLMFGVIFKKIRVNVNAKCLLSKNPIAIRAIHLHSLKSRKNVCFFYCYLIVTYLGIYIRVFIHNYE